MPKGGRIKKSWNFLSGLAQMSSLSWCIISEFNDILSTEENKGRSELPHRLIQGLRQAVLDAGLNDLVNPTWSNFFPNAKLECLRLRYQIIT